MKTLSLTTAALLLSASAAFAAPCNTDKGKSPDQATNQKSSDTDKSSKNTAGGDQPASPGTVGALNNLGPNQGVTGQQASGDKKDAGKEDPAAKNTAGGNQPASPGTVGAMNNAEKTQTVGKDDGC